MQVKSENTNKSILFIADRVSLRGPRVGDGSYTITFETGEFAWDMIKDLPNLNGESIVVNVSKYDQTSNDTSTKNNA